MSNEVSISFSLTWGFGCTFQIISMTSKCKVHDLWVALTIRMRQMNLLFYFLQEIEEVEVIHLLQFDGLWFLRPWAFQSQWFKVKMTLVLFSVYTSPRKVGSLQYATIVVWTDLMVSHFSMQEIVLPLLGQTLQSCRKLDCSSYQEAGWTPTEAMLSMKEIRFQTNKSTL